jgi:hypothetical protein
MIRDGINAMLAILPFSTAAATDTVVIDQVISQSMRKQALFWCDNAASHDAPNKRTQTPLKMHQRNQRWHHTHGLLPTKND